MPLPKGKQAVGMAKAREALAEKKAALDSETAKEDIWNKLKAANSRIDELELLLLQKTTECTTLQSDLEKTNGKLAKFQADASLWKEKHQDTYHELRMQRQTTKRWKDKIGQLHDQVKILEQAERDASAQSLRGSQQSKQALASLRSLQDENNGLRSELSKAIGSWTSKLAGVHSKLELSKEKLQVLREEAYKLRRTVTRAKEIQENAVAKVKAKILQERSEHHLTSKGIFTEDTRNVVRLLVKAGCSRNYIDQVISTVLKSAGIKAIGTISRPSVSRILREGYFAAQVQLGWEMKNAESMTFSADGTSHRSINYNSRHVHLLVEDYASSESEKKQRVTRTFGIQSSLDGSSEEAMADWKRILNANIEIYNNSPLGKRSGSIFKLIELLIKLMGMNTDHCAKEKKDARMLKELKAWAVDQHLGEEMLLDMSFTEITEHFKKAEENMIKKAGGKNKWDNLSDASKTERKAAMLEAAVAELGKEAFSELSEEEKRIYRLFIWAGCGCHKDLNTVQGGYLSMLTWWIENESEEVVRPVLLANRDNDPVVKERTTSIEQGNVPTPAQERAFQKSTRGAVKTAQIAGAVFNHKDDKKGHHDIFRFWWWEHVGVPFTFPDTSNNRFQSYCDAAAALILYGEEFKLFLESLRINKQNSTLNHMEMNLWNALHCSSTTTELAVLAIYAECVSYPYMKSIRTSSEKNQNMLNLGPLHSRVYDHMQKIINDPDMLIANLDPATSYETATLDGEKWQNINVVQKIKDLIPELPHFRELLLAFFKGAAETWERFTSEFAPGSLIDEATVEEKELAWLPATNDENEGALGAFRVLMRRQPQLTLLDYNALAMYFRNNTVAFMAAKFTEEEDYKYIHKLARETGGMERKRRREIVEYRDKRQAEKTTRKAVREQNAQKTAARIAQLELVLEKEKIPGLKGNTLKDQLKLFKQSGAPNLQTGRQPTLVNDIRKALMDAIDLYVEGSWKLYDDEEIEEGEQGWSDSEGDSSDEGFQ